MNRSTGISHVDVSCISNGLTDIANITLACFFNLKERKNVSITRKAETIKGQGGSSVSKDIFTNN